MKTQPAVINFNFLPELFIVSYQSDIDLKAFFVFSFSFCLLFFFLPLPTFFSFFSVGWRPSLLKERVMKALWVGVGSSARG